MFRKVGLLVLLSIICLSLPAFADFKGHHAAGGWGLQSGSQAPMPGDYIISPLYSRYYSDTARDQYGNELDLTGTHNDIGVNVIGLFGWWVSEHKILGANWGMLGAAYVTDNRVDYNDFAARSDYSFGDIYFQPANLGWHLKQADFMLSYGMYIPTGKYGLGADDNSGLGMWTHEFGAGSTLYFDAERKWHISALGTFEFHTEKEDTNIQVGNVFTVEGGLGRSWYEGALSAGVAYYAQWKLNKDKLDDLDELDARLPSSISLKKSQLFGLGPEVNIPILAKQKLICVVTARYQWEFDAKSTLEGQTFNLLVNFPFGLEQ